MNIVLLEPEIPFNTGAIGRTCVATGTHLHLIRPYGFILSDRNLKRAGLDYWEKLKLTEYKNYEDFLEKNPDLLTVEGRISGLWYATTKATQTYADVSYGPNDYIMFGKETAGIPEEILAGHKDSCIRIPMLDDERSLNLSNAATVILYEALRQNGFAGLRRQGELHRLTWDE
ncbi:MAG: tRNA (cytidine(34)-2'-O)-methyltransferase [Lachnospiraceae bacterium]|nr:tRNA (cytidine(34)-2'-O)-methyltransferase [Lachnospiraceae bacterium]